MTSDPRHYRIHEVLGEGGFGKVYRAESAGRGALPRMVALKILHAGLPNGDEVAMRLRDEARMLALLRHRAIVQVDSLVRVDDRWCAVMEYVKGTDLRSVMAISGRAPASAALELVAEVAGALHEAFTTVVGERPLKLIHRDIKPSNIQLTAAGEVKLLDFGIARADFGEREAQTRSIAYGTIDYMAPERMLFESTPGGDVYGLGIVLVELLLGRAMGHTLPDQRKHQARVADIVDEVANQTRSRGIAEFVERLLAYVPSERPDARETQRHAQMLARTSRGETLRDWAERVVVEARAAHPSREDPLCGQTLHERGRDADGTDRYVSGNAPVVARPPTRTTSDPFATRPTKAGLGLAVGGVALAIGLFAVVAVAGILAWLWWPREPAVVEPPAVEVVEPVVIEPPPPPIVEPPARKRKPVVVVAPVVVAAVEPVAPPPEGRVIVKGDAAEVQFVGEEGTYSPGPLPGGAYKIRGRFRGGATRALGTVEIPEGATVTLNCVEAFERCNRI